MKYNEKYDRYVTKGGLVYRYNAEKDRLVQCKLSVNSYGYNIIKVQKPKICTIKVHRLVYETFVGEIPSSYEIDHINTIRDDNRIENLRCVSHKENCNNSLTRTHHSKAAKGNHNCEGITRSDFGRKFKEYYGITKCENAKLYRKEYKWYHRHNNKCRWEK